MTLAILLTPLLCGSLTRYTEPMIAEKQKVAVLILLHRLQNIINNMSTGHFQSEGLSKLPRKVLLILCDL